VTKFEGQAEIWVGGRKLASVDDAFARVEANEPKIERPAQPSVIQLQIERSELATELVDDMTRNWPPPELRIDPELAAQVREAMAESLRKWIAPDGLRFQPPPLLLDDEFMVPRELPSYVRFIGPDGKQFGREIGPFRLPLMPYIPADFADELLAKYARAERRRASRRIKRRRRAHAKARRRGKR
jgi:hypothetical protein